MWLGIETWNTEKLNSSVSIPRMSGCQDFRISVNLNPALKTTFGLAPTLILIEAPIWQASSF